jgi:hypothetical protein
VVGGQEADFGQQFPTVVDNSFKGFEKGIKFSRLGSQMGM